MAEGLDPTEGLHRRLRLQGRQTEDPRRLEEEGIRLSCPRHRLSRAGGPQRTLPQRIPMG